LRPPPSARDRQFRSAGFAAPRDRQFRGSFFASLRLRERPAGLCVLVDPWRSSRETGSSVVPSLRPLRPLREIGGSLRPLPPPAP
jgi:hypothetical protein